MKHYSSTESLSLPRRQKVFDSPQLVPAGDALPIWKKLSLDTKLPVVPSPRGSYTLYTTGVGKPKYIHKQHYDFDLNDALYARPAEYDSLHDPFLKQYFHKPRARRQLLHNDLITRDGKVKCGIKEFNDYRSYLRYRSVTELSLQRSGDREEESWLPARNAKSETPRRKESQESSKPTDLEHLYGRDVSLVQRMRMREQTLLKRLEEKQRERESEHERRVSESWQQRKQRQQRLLQQEEEIERKAVEERAQLVEQREQAISRRREKMLAKLGRKHHHNNVNHNNHNQQDATHKNDESNEKTAKRTEPGGNDETKGDQSREAEQMSSSEDA